MHVFCHKGRYSGRGFARHWHDLARLDDAVGIAAEVRVLVKEPASVGVGGPAQREMPAPAVEVEDRARKGAAGYAGRA